MAQQTFSEAYGSQPANPVKGSWLARVSHRASHIPNRPFHRPESILGGPGGLSQRDSLPLRAPGTSGVVTQEQLPVAQRTNSYPASPADADSPTETEFGATPIDSSFGDRIDTSPPSTSSTAANSATSSTHDRSAGQPLRQRPGRAGTVTQADLVAVNSHQPSEEKMQKYAVQAGDHTYDSDGEADDEFERSVFTSPALPEGFEDDDGTDHPSETEDEHDSLEGEDTPTTQGWADRYGRSPTGKISEWSEDEVADYISSLSPALKQYGSRFIEEGVSGDVVVALGHDELRELGVASAGHRLTILKAVYEMKMRSGVRVEEGDYIPLSAESEKADMTATQDDITRIIESIRLRDQRIIAAEAELRALKHDLDRISEENRKLREETLPIMRMMKDQRTPLPDPSAPMPSPREAEAPRQSQLGQSQPSQDSGSLSRKFSKRILPSLGKDASKQASPTMATYSPSIRDDGQPHLEASAAAMAASSHLTATMTSQPSPNTPHGQQVSPTSPGYNIQQPPSSAGYHPSSNSSHWSQASTAVGDGPPSARAHGASRRQPTPSPREEEGPSSSRGERAEKDNPQVEIFKSFRVSIDDPCRVVLPVALKRYNITDDWRQYALYIVHGDQERCLGLEEKPLMLFKQLDREGRKPMFMLRRHASPQEGWSSTTGGDPANRTIPGGVL